jgi:hypothetical protein
VSIRNCRLLYLSVTKRRSVVVGRTCAAGYWAVTLAGFCAAAVGDICAVAVAGVWEITLVGCCAVAVFDRCAFRVSCAVPWRLQEVG